MGTGYTRQSAAEIAPGNTITAVGIENEFDAIQAAFNGTTGHAHDGTTGEGPKISLTTSVSGILPVANGGTAGINKIDATIAPTINDDSGDGYVVGSVWIDVTADIAYECLDATVGAAVWRRYQPYDAELNAIAGLTSAADKVPYFTGSGTAALADFPAYGRLIAGSVSEAGFKAGVNLEIGTDVQEWSPALDAWATEDPADYLTTAAAAAGYQPLDADLTAWAGVNPSAYLNTAGIAAAYQPLDAGLTALAAFNTNGILVQSADNTFVGRTLTGTANEITVTNGTGVSGNPTLSLPAAMTFTGKTVTGGTFSAPTISGAYTISGGTDIALADGGTGASLTDPNADRIMFWDDSAGAVTWLTAGTGLTITGTTIDASTVSAASETAAGIIEIATSAEVITGTDNTRAVTPSGLQAMTASDTRDGIVELATDAETVTGTDATRATTPASVKAAISASNSYTWITARNTTSGSTSDETVPAGVKEVIIVLNAIGVSTNATVSMRIGDSGGIESSGYIDADGGTGEWDLTGTITGTDLVKGTLFLYSGSASNSWVLSGGSGDNAERQPRYGTKDLSNELTTIRVFTSAGSFDAGSWQVGYKL